MRFAKLVIDGLPHSKGVKITLNGQDITDIVRNVEYKITPDTQFYTVNLELIISELVVNDGLPSERDKLDEKKVVETVRQELFNTLGGI
jgi:hypothetical protein